MDAGKGVKVILNGTIASLPREVSFQELVSIALPDVVHSNTIEWEVDYQSLDMKSPRELRPEQTMEVSREMTINVSYTDKS